MSSHEAAVHLAGMTWNHTRGLLPMQATAQRYAELHPEVEVHWEKRSLQQFADAPLSELATRFDLLVIDHPSIGEAAHLDCLLPLDQWLPAEFLADQAAHSVGTSHDSYLYNGHRYALAIDAATPVAGWRPDLLGRNGANVPATWDDLLELARRGLVTLPAIPIDSLMNFFMLANALDAEPFSDSDRVVPSRDAGMEALRLLRELVQVAAQGSLQRNPIATWQMLATEDTVAYCPFAYGYSNYSRAGYAPIQITTGGLVTLQGKRLRSTLGGAGLAVSRRCNQPQQAMGYVCFVAEALTQRTLYAFAGGQPGHRGAWVDEALNRHTNDFFRNTLPTLDQAWVRPRFPGFIAFQDEASRIVHAYLQEGSAERDVLGAMNDALRRHRPAGAAQ